MNITFKFNLSKRRLVVFLLDVFLIGFAFVSAFLLRFDLSIPQEFHLVFWQGFAAVMLVKPPVLLISGHYQNIWRYASLQDGIEILKVVTTSSVLAVFVLMYYRHFAPYPRSIFLLDWFLLFAMMSASRLFFRIYRENVLRSKHSEGPRTLVIGAGTTGSMMTKEIRRQSDAAFNIIGFIDDDPEKRGMKLHGIPVIGNTEELNTLITKYRVEDVIIAMSSSNSRVIRRVVESCKCANVRFKTLPAIADLIDGSFSVSQIKNVEIEDLLGRDPVKLDRRQIGGYLTDRRVLISGAAGSIGSEICRQVARFNPAKLILLEQAETPLYEIEKELIATFPDLHIIPLVADVRDKDMIEVAFEEFAPEVVFHAAAYKHVPMMEYNPVQAVLNNVFGSKNIADAAHKFKVNNLVMISTDKAVNPTNIMGTTKRVSEIYVQALSGISATKFTTVRFGNVLGSNGSVIPLFKQQIASGVPVTVTDKNIIRYFMTIFEAVQLVLQAGSMELGSKILVLDMGEPVRIVDLAEELIRLSGFTPYEDIDIVFTGLRPGEKLFEELLISGEGILPTTHDKIKVLAPIHFDLKTMEAELTNLYQAARINDISGLLASLKAIVPEFEPSYCFTGTAPAAFQQMRSDLFPAADKKQAKVLHLGKPGLH